jgi:hypothetical protein
LKDEKEEVRREGKNPIEGRKRIKCGNEDRRGRI